jgi:hypothetical protein
MFADNADVPYLVQLYLLTYVVVSRTIYQTACGPLSWPLLGVGPRL